MKIVIGIVIPKWLLMYVFCKAKEDVLLTASWL